MEFAKIEKYFKLACSLSNDRNAINEYLQSAKNIFNSVTANQTVTLGSETYSLNYEPAVEPIKNMYGQYVRVFSGVVEQLDSFIKELMNNLAKVILSSNDSQISEIMSKMEQDYEKMKEDESICCKADKIRELMEKIFSIIVKGVEDKKQPTSSPAAIAEFVASYIKALDLYDSNAEIRVGFDRLKGLLKALNDILSGLNADITAFNEIQIETDLKAMRAPLEKVYNKLEMVASIKSSENNKLSEIIRQADKMVTELNGKIEKEIEDLFSDLTSAASAAGKVNNQSDLETMIRSLDELYSKFVSLLSVKKNGEIKFSDKLKKADMLMNNAQSKIKAEMDRRMAPISTAFARINPTVPAEPQKSPNLQAEEVVEIKPGERGIDARKVPFDTLSQKKNVVTLTLSSVFASQNDGKDCKGLFTLKVLKEKNVVSSDAEVLFIVDDGYSEIQLPKGEDLRSNDVNEKEEVYFSISVFEKLKKLIPINIANTSRIKPGTAGNIIPN